MCATQHRCDAAALSPTIIVLKISYYKISAKVPIDARLFTVIIQSPIELRSIFTFISRPADCVRLAIHSSLPAWLRGYLEERKKRTWPLPSIHSESTPDASGG